MMREFYFRSDMPQLKQPQCIGWWQKEYEVLKLPACMVFKMVSVLHDDYIPTYVKTGDFQFM